MDVVILVHLKYYFLFIFQKASKPKKLDMKEWVELLKNGKPCLQKEVNIFQHDVETA